MEKVAAFAEPWRWFAESRFARRASFQSDPSETGLSARVMSFGRRQAYESPRGRNPRATGDGYGDFGFRQMSAMARPPSGSGGFDAAGPLRLASARCCPLAVRQCDMELDKRIWEACLRWQCAKRLEKMGLTPSYAAIDIDRTPCFV